MNSPRGLEIPLTTLPSTTRVPHAMRTALSILVLGAALSTPAAAARADVGELMGRFHQAFRPEKATDPSQGGQSCATPLVAELKSH